MNRSVPDVDIVEATETRVLAAVVHRSGRFLICRRAPEKRHGGLWEFPGGKVEAGESDRAAISREFAEELFRKEVPRSLKRS